MARTRKKWDISDDALTVRKAKALVMLEKGCSYRQIQSETGLAKDTITRVKKGQNIAGIPVGMITALRSQEVAKLTLASHKILDEVITNDEKIKKASLHQLGATAALLLDKRELLAGRPTHRVERSLSDEELVNRLKDLGKEINEITANALPEEIEEAQLDALPLSTSED